MEYYTQKSKLILTEYGRNIQQMVEYAMTIEDRAERQRCVNTIINVMGNLFPHLRDINDFKHKLWDHLAVMSDYKLDIDYPYEVPKQKQNTRPEKLPYPAPLKKDRHYGHLLNRFVNVAAEYNGPDKIKLINALANHAKKSFLMWNSEATNDKKILDDIRRMSDGKLQFDDSEIHMKENRELIYSSQSKNRPQNNKRPHNNYKR